MTTVVARQIKGDVEFASDTQFSTGSRKSPNSVSKVFENGEVVFATSGAVRDANIVRFMKIPKPPHSRKAAAVDRYIVRDLIPALISALSDAKSLTVNNGDAEPDSEFLVAVNGVLRRIGGGFGLTSQANGFDSIGSGSSYALGAMKAGADPATAVSIASQFDAFTGGKVQTATYSALVQ